MGINSETFIVFRPGSWEQAKNIAYKLSGWIFRGQSKASYKLESSVERAAQIYGIKRVNIHNYEIEIINNFQRNAHQYMQSVPQPNNILEWLSIIQHYGGPTRLLDFTYSFYIACFFAVQYSTEDAAVWCANKRKLEDDARRVISGKSDNWPNYDFSSQIFYKHAIYGETNHLAAIATEPFRKNERMSLQQGLFVFPFNVSESIESNLFSIPSLNINDLEYPIDGNKFDNSQLEGFVDEGRCLKIVLDNKLHKEIRKDLIQMNINPSTLFPGLDGYVKSLINCLFC